MTLAKRFAALVATFILGRRRLWPMLLATGFAIGPIAASPLSVDAAVVQVCPSGCAFTTIQGALASAGNGDEIDIAAGTYSGGFTTSVNVALVGSGAGSTVVTGGGPVMTVPMGTTVAVSSLSITGGNNPGGSGGGILNLGQLTLTRVAIAGNAAAYGGGITNVGVLTLNGIVTNNAATVNGGGIFNRPTARVTVEDSTLTDNTAGRFGAGIRNLGTMTIDSSVVSDNSTNSDGMGGGISNAGRLSVSDSSIIGNAGGAGGGGLENVNEAGGAAGIEGTTTTPGTAGLSHTQIAGNTAAYGGGILQLGGNLTIVGGLINFNTASVVGGGIFLSDGVVTLVNSSVVTNAPDNCAPPNSVAGCTG